MFSLDQCDYLETIFFKLFSAVLVIHHNPRTRIYPELQWVSVRLVIADTPVGVLSPLTGHHDINVKCFEKSSLFPVGSRLGIQVSLRGF